MDCISTPRHVDEKANEDLSPTSSVAAWLQQTQTPPKRKVDTAIGTLARPPKRKCRMPLTAVEGNIMRRSLRGRRAGDQKPATRQPETPQRVAGGQDETVFNDITPRGPSAPSAPSLPLPSSSDASSARAQSPTKMAALKNMHKGLEYHLIDYTMVKKDPNHPLHPIVDFVRKMDDLLQGIGVIPANQRHECRIADPQAFRLSSLFDSDEETSREDLGSSPSIQEVTEVWEDSVELETIQETEAGWNCGVHYPIAKMARKMSKHSDKFELRNITTAKIQPKSLAPVRVGGGKLQPKMVDFAFVLAPTSITEAGYQNLDLPADAPAESYNQTCQNTVLNKPIAISIETKAGTASPDESLPQLTIWSHAQFTKLEQLMKQSQPSALTDKPLPHLLLATAHGPRWYFLIAWRDESGRQSLYRFPDAVSTSRKVGVFQTVAALQLMLQYTVDIYQPWFEHNCVPLRQAQRTSFGLDQTSDS